MDEALKLAQTSDLAGRIKCPLCLLASDWKVKQELFKTAKSSSFVLKLMPFKNTELDSFKEELQCFSFHSHQ